jgi:hypothetical protein
MHFPEGMIIASFKRPRKRKLIYGAYLTEKSVPKEIIHRGEVYILYGIS